MKRMDEAFWRLGFLTPLLLLTLAACGPKQHILSEEVHQQSEASLVTSCNEMNMGSIRVQAWSPDSSNYRDHVILKFSDNPVGAKNDYIQLAKWSDDDMNYSYRASYRVRTWQNGIEVRIAGYEDTGKVTSDLVKYYKEVMGKKGLDTSGNFFSRLEFLIKEVDYSWKGFTVHRKSGDATSALLPPFELQYSVYQSKQPAALHPYHPLHRSGPMSRGELLGLESSYCSLY